jgi:hypothetical protein
MGISNGILAVPRNRKLPELHSESSAEEKITGILFRGTKIEGTLLILFEPFRGRLPYRPQIGPPGAYIFPMG